MSVNESVYGAKEVWTAPYGDAAITTNTIKIANYNLPSPNGQSRFWCQMYTNTTPNYTIFNNWDNRSNTIIDDSIVPFGIGSGSGLSNIDWYTVKNGVVSETPSNRDNRQITNIAFSYDDHMAASTWCLDGEGSITGGIATAQTYNQRLCYNRWSNLYGTAFSTGSSSAGGGSSRFTTAWYNSRLFTYLPTKNLVLTPRAVIVNASGTSTSYSKISDIIAHKNDGKLIRFGARFSYKPTGTRTDVPIAPFFMDDTNVQKGFDNYPVPTGGSPQIVDQAIKLPIIYNRNNTGFFILLGTGAYDYYISVPTNDTTHTYTWATFQGDKIKFTPEIINSRMYMVADISQLTDAEIESELLTQMAYMGMLFVTDEANVTVSIYDDKMYCGEIKDGVTTGKYTHGTANLLQPQMQWDDFFQSGYSPDDPPEPPDPNVYDTASQLNTPSKCASGTKYYVLNAAAVENLVGELWKAQDSIPPDTSYMDFNNEQYLSNNPIDMIVSCKRYPLAPLKASDSEALVLGQYQTNVQGYELSDTTTWINLGSKLIYRHFKNYLDYQTKITLYIPFCGMINLDPSVWIGQTVNVYMAVDYITGSCTAYIIRDSDKVIYATAEGNCSVDLPITGLQAATIEAQLMRSKSSLDSSKLMIGAKIIGGAAAFAVAAATGGTGAAAAPAVIGGVTTIASTISDAYKINQLNYDLHHTDAPVQQIGSSSPLNAWSGELECRLYVYYPAVDPDVDNAAYAHSIGNATVQQGTIGSFGSSGEYAVITNADLSDINCTDSEKVMINNALTSGVYL